MNERRWLLTVAWERRIGYALLALTALTFVATASVDNGYNWDEWKQTEAMRETVRDVRYHKTQPTWNDIAFLPGVVVALWHALPDLPEIVTELRRRPYMPFEASHYPTLSRWQTDMYRRLGTEGFKAEVRTVHMLWTLPALLWVFLTVLRLFPHRHLAAGAAAAFLGLSWEIAMRARNTEVDAPMMQFVALVVYLTTVVLTVKTRDQRLLATIGIGAAAGLVLACKVSGIWVGVAALVVVLFAPVGETVRRRVILVGAFVAAFVAAFAVASPDSYVDPLRAVHNSFFVVADYRSVHTSHPYYVAPFGDHFGRVLLWLFCVQPSSSVPLAILLSCVTLAGFVHLGRARRKFMILVALHPITLLASMVSLPLLQLRNYLQLAPLAAVAFGAGVVAIGALLERRPRVRLAFGGVLAAIFVFNAGWLFVADHSVRTTDRYTILADLREHIEETDHDLVVSPKVAQALDGYLATHFECVQGGELGELHDPRVVFYFQEHNPWLYKAVRMGFYERIFGPLDANYDWYTLWKGKWEHQRIIWMTPENATEMTLAMGGFQRCRRK